MNLQTLSCLILLIPFQSALGMKKIVENCNNQTKKLDIVFISPEKKYSSENLKINLDRIEIKSIISVMINKKISTVNMSPCRFLKFLKQKQKMAENIEIEYIKQISDLVSNLEKEKTLSNTKKNSLFSNLETSDLINKLQDANLRLNNRYNQLKKENKKLQQQTNKTNDELLIKNHRLEKENKKFHRDNMTSCCLIYTTAILASSFGLCLGAKL